MAANFAANLRHRLPVKLIRIWVGQIRTIHLLDWLSSRTSALTFEPDNNEGKSIIRVEPAKRKWIHLRSWSSGWVAAHQSSQGSSHFIWPDKSEACALVTSTSARLCNRATGPTSGWAPIQMRANWNWNFSFDPECESRFEELSQTENTGLFLHTHTYT